MRIVIDASAIIAVIANEPEKATLLELTTGTDLIAPVSIHFEIGNAFSAMLKRRRIMLTQVLAAIALYQSILIRFVEIELPASLEIADQLSIYAYDAYLIRTAEKYRAPLLTLDKTLQHHAQSYGVKVLEVTQ
ncbi:MAG: type II toxin-antitoxin system VapC family toxin [Chloroflexota bacterium]|nr:type II toxin-antitoxin system VapC family toxin [Chloroflexota bacterium]